VNKFKHQEEVGNMSNVQRGKMRSTLVMVLLGALAVGAAATDKNVIVKTDKFTGKSTVIMKEISIGTFSDKTHLSGLVNLYLAACSLSDQPKPTALIIYSHSTNWQFLDGADVYLLVDGERIELGHFVSTKGTVDAVGSSVLLNETIAAPIDRSVFDKIGVSKSVEIKIGTYETKLNTKGIERFREFAAALPAGSTR
jgi:hypothetical protein